MESRSSAPTKPARVRRRYLASVRACVRSRTSDPGVRSSTPRFPVDLLGREGTFPVEATMVDRGVGRGLRSRLPDSNRRPEDLHGGRRWSGSLAYSPPLYH